MSEIPDDIAKKARKLAEIQCGSDDQCVFPGPCQCRDAIALAILAERERQQEAVGNLLRAIGVRNEALERYENGEMGQ